MLMLDPASILMLEVSRGLLLRFQTGNAGQYAHNNYDEACRRLTYFSRQLTVLSELSGSGEPQLVLTSKEETD